MYGTVGAIFEELSGLPVMTCLFTGSASSAEMTLLASFAAPLLHTWFCAACKTIPAERKQVLQCAENEGEL